MKKSFTFLASLVVSLVVDAADANVITFADPHVKSICIEHWDTDGDGELSTDEAAAVQSLGHYFSNDKEMRSFDELQYFTGLLSIAPLDFDNCENLTSIQLPPQIRKISDNAFRSCSQLTSIHIPGSATSIGENAFNGCFRLASVTFGEGVNFRAANDWKESSQIKKSFTPGDVNHDGLVNVLDVTLIVEYIIGSPPENLYLEEADVNDDSLINALDVTQIISMILNQ